MSHWKPDSYPSMSPYLMCHNAKRLIAFLEAAFDGTVQRRFDRPDGSVMHAEVKIDDSIVMIGGGMTTTATPSPHIHLYVKDVVAVFEQAVAAGAQIVQEPVRKTADDDLRGGVQDPWNTTWWIATQ